MKTKVLIFLMVITLIDSIAIAGTNVTNEKNATAEVTKYETQLRSRIAGRLSYPNDITDCCKYEAGIIFSVNDENRIIVHHVLCENNTICEFIKTRLNGKKMKSHPSVKNREFYVNIKFKYEGQ
ncbi:hypothetical protein ACFLTE_03760 [Bacteroidota bacterium]